LRQTLRGQADVRSTRFSDDRVIIFQKADKPWPHACMGQWCLGINVPVAVDKWFLFLLAGSLGAGDEGIEKLQRINADEELSADVDVLVTYVDDCLIRQVVGKRSGVDLDKAGVGGKEQVRRFHNFLDSRRGCLAVIGAEE